MKFTWLNNNFICKDLYAPFKVEKDNDYIKDLHKRFSILLRQAKSAGADTESIAIIENYKAKIMEALKCYYQADIAKSNTIIKNLIKK